MPFLHPEYLVEPEWLAAHLDDPLVRVLDVTAKLTAKFDNRAAADCFAVAHIPGSRFLDVGAGRGEFHDPDAALPWTWPSPERFAALMGSLGVDNDTHVVLVAATPRPGVDAGTMWCTRAWWTMHHFGVRSSILWGGLERWQAEGRPLTASPAAPAPLSTFVVPDGWQRGRADRHDVQAALQAGNACVLDSLSAASFRGDAPGYGPRAGHITGAEHLSATALIEAETAGFLPADALKAELDGLGLLQQERVVTYCGGAIAATVTAFALALFGHDNVAVYDASLMEWAADETLPMTGLPTTIMLPTTNTLPTLPTSAEWTQS